MAKRKMTKSTRGKAPSPRGKKGKEIKFEEDNTPDSSDASQGAQEYPEASKFQKSKEDIKKEKTHKHGYALKQTI